jgi:hypothetical protein
MTVNVRSFILGGGGRRPVTRFTDSLLSPDQPFAVGDLWTPTQNLVNPPVGNAYAGVDVAAALNRGATGLAYTNPGGGGFTPVVNVIPVPIDWSVAIFKNQYAQFKSVSNGAGINRPGVCVFYNANSAGHYNLQLQVETSQFILGRNNGVTQTTLVAASPTTAYVIGDVLRIEVDATTTPGTTIVKGFKNGVLIATFNDNGGTRLTNGQFGLYFGGSNPAIVTIVRDFDGGTL